MNRNTVSYEEELLTSRILRDAGDDPARFSRTVRSYVLKSRQYTHTDPHVRGYVPGAVFFLDCTRDPALQ